MKLLLPSRYPSVFRRSSGLASDNAPPLHSNTAAGESCQLGDQPSGETINPILSRRPLLSIFVLASCSSWAFCELFFSLLGTVSLLSWSWMLVAVSANQAPPSGRASFVGGDWSAGASSIPHSLLCPHTSLLSGSEQPLLRAPCQTPAPLLFPPHKTLQPHHLSQPQNGKNVQKVLDALTLT